MLLGALTAAVLLTRWRRLAWLAIPYALHIAMDIPTHERYQTRPFHPLSDWQSDGLSWPTDESSGPTWRRWRSCTHGC